MKHAMNFRLNEQSIGILTVLEAKMHTSKTSIIEQALEFFAAKKNVKNNLLRYAGILGDYQSDALLKAIKAHKHNKKLEINL